MGLNLSFIFVWLEDFCRLNVYVIPNLNIEALTLQLRPVRSQTIRLSHKDETLIFQTDFRGRGRNTRAVAQPCEGPEKGAILSPGKDSC